MLKYGDVFRLLRKSHNINLNNLSDSLRIDIDYIMKLENNTEIPNKDVINKYSNFFKIQKSLINFLAKIENSNKNNYKLIKIIFKYLKKLEVNITD